MSIHQRRLLGRNRSLGFTLVELLVVITIIGMLMALLLPAVNAAVESARSVTCKNNIGQLAKATNTYQSDKGNFPGYENNRGGTNVSWVVELMAQLGRQDLHDEWSGGSGPDVYMELLVCPSDPPDQPGKSILSYVANSGGPDPASSKKQYNGIFLESGSKNNVDNVQDGLATTLLLSENVQAVKWNVPTRNQTTFMWQTGSGTSDQKINGGDLKAAVTDNTARPSAYHSGGVNVAFVDTHVIFLKQSIDYKVYRQLMTPYHTESDAPSGDSILDESKYR